MTRTAGVALFVLCLAAAEPASPKLVPPKLVPGGRIAPADSAAGSERHG